MVDERLEARLARHAGCAEVEARDMVHRGEYGGGVLRRKGEDGACFGTIGRVCVVLREERGGEGQGEAGRGAARLRGRVEPACVEERGRGTTAEGKREAMMDAIPNIVRQYL